MILTFEFDKFIGAETDWHHEIIVPLAQIICAPPPQKKSQFF